MKKMMLWITTLFLLCFASSSLAALEPPVLSSSTDGLNLSVSWTEVPGATGYTLHYAQYPYSPGDPIDSFDRGGATSFSIDLWVGAAYYIAVTAYDDQENSKYSNVETVNIEVVQVPPVAPELSVTTSGLNVSLSWETVPDATGYILSYAPTSSYSGPASFITKDVGGDTSFQAVLWDGATYYVAVQAYNEQGNSGYSNIELFTIQADLTSLSSLISPGGGLISVYNSRGDRITLDLPPGALRETTEITVTALDTPPAAPFSMSLFPGVSLEPHGLLLDETATLRVSFAEPQANPKTSLLVWTVDADTAIPLGNQTSTTTEISGEIYNFSDKTGGQPSPEETEKMVLTMEDKLRLVGFLDDKYGWADTRLMVEAFISLYSQADALGNVEIADKFFNKALGALEMGVLNFLTFEVPAIPCSEYVPILNKYLKYVKALFLNDFELENLLVEKLLAVNSDWCCFSLSGTWSAKEVADERACGEEINTYTSTATVSQVGGLVAMTGMGGYFTASKSKCSLFGWGGESEDGGTSFGNGSGSISADGNKITLSGSWTWSGIVDGVPESCSGTSRGTLSR